MDNKISIIKEWNLFWQSFVEDEDKEVEKIESLSLAEIKKLTKTLSKNRKIFNQKIEQIQRELELYNIKLESLRIVGGQVEPIQEKIESLNQLGHEMSESLSSLDQKLKKLHEREVVLLESEAIL